MVNYTTDEESWLECVSSAMPFSGAMNLSDEEIAATSECVDVEACGEGFLGIYQQSFFCTKTLF